MLKTLFSYVVGLGEKQADIKSKITEVNGLTYTTEDLNRLSCPGPSKLEINTLNGLIDYIKSNPDCLNISDLIIHVFSPTQVKLFSSLYEDNSREYYIQSDAMLPRIELNNYIDAERFNVQLQSCFCQTEHSAAVLKVVGNIRDEAVKIIGDDGISQEVTVRKGVQTAGNAMVPNPVILAPFRTFAEVPQPESKFILRMKDGPSAGLFEADGGAWRIEAMQNIKDYLAKSLTGLDVKIIS